MKQTMRWPAFFASQLRRNIATGMSAAILSVLVGLASYPIYLHFLGYEKYGVWLALSTVLTFAQLGNFGINPAVSKLVAEAYGAGSIIGIRRCVTTAWLAVSIPGIAVFFAVLTLRNDIPRMFNVSGSNRDLMAALLPFVALFSIGIFLVESLNAALVGLGRMDLESYFRICSQVIALVCSGILLSTGHGVVSLLVGNTVAYLAMHILSLVTVRKIIGTRLITIRDCNLDELSRILRFGGWVFGTSVINMALSPLNRVLLSRYAGVAVLPTYEIAYGSAMRVRSLIESGLRAMMPEISRISTPLTRETLNRAVSMQRSGLRLIASLGLFLYGSVFVMTTPLLRIWLRSQFQSALPLPFRIMLVASFFSLLGVPAYYILLGLGQAKMCFITAAILAGASISTIAIAFVLTHSISVVIITLGVMAGMGFSSVFLLWRVSQLKAAATAPPLPASSPKLCVNHSSIV
jgi:O-antigen/teichoic acid export membrane protein